MPNHAGGADHFKEGVVQKLLPLNSYIFQGLLLKKYFKESGADLVYAHYASGYGSLLRYSGIKDSVLAVWGSDIYDFPRKSPLHRRMIEKNLAFPKGLFSTGHLMAEEAGKYTDRPFEITPFGVDRDIFYPAENHRESFLKNIADKKIKICYIKSLKEIYGPKYLIQALALLNKRESIKEAGWQISLDLYGQGEMENYLKRLVIQMGLKNEVKFHGYIANRDVPAALAKADIFCVPSLRESFGVSEVEAMACGVVSICSDADGFREVTDSGNCAYMVKKTDAEAIADAIEEILTKPNEALNKVDLALKKVKEEYSWSDNIRKIEKSLMDKIG